MELPPDFWTAAGALVTLVGLLGAGAKWLISRRQEGEDSRIGKEAIDLRRKAFESDSVPQISVELHNAVEFPGYGVMREGANYALTPPSPWTKPTALLVVTVKNEGKIRVTTNEAGIRLERTGGVMSLPQSQTDPARQELIFPYPLPPRESFEIRIQPVLIKRMLGVLQAQPGDEFTFWVSERIGTSYFSTPQAASDFLEDREPFNVAINFESLVTVTQIGEEEYFPEGIYPAGLTDMPTPEQGKK